MSERPGPSELAEPDGRRARWIFALIFAVALVLRVVATMQYEAGHPHAAHPVIDEASYDRWAREIAGGEWLGREVFFQEPLYPYTLGVLYALFGPERIVARLAQCVLGALAAVLAGVLARRAIGKRVGFVTAALLAVYWPGLLFPPLLLKENLFLPVFAAFAWLLIATRDARHPRALWFACGFAGALGALLRGNMLVLLPVFAAWPLGRALIDRYMKRESSAWFRSLAASACIVAGIACVLVPVAWRNQRVGGVFVLTTSGAGTNLYGGNNLENEYGRASEFSFTRGIPEYEAGDWRHEAERRTGRTLNAAEVSDFWKHETARSFREHPREHAAILWNKLRLTLGAYEVPDNHMLAWDARYVPIARLPWPGFGIVGAFGIAGLLLWLVHRHRSLASFGAASPRDPGAALDLAALFALYLATIVLTVTSDRSRLPLIVLLAPFAGCAVIWLWDALREKAGAALVAGGMALITATFVVHWPVLRPSEIAEDLDERDYNLAVQWLTDEREPGKHVGEARALAATLAQRYPRSARMQLLAADIDVRRAIELAARADVASRNAGREQLADVVARVDRLADEPTLNARERFRAQSLSAWIHLQLGDWLGAEKRAREALEFDRESIDLQLQLVRALLGAADDPSNAEARTKIDESLRVLDELRSASLDPDPYRESERALLHAQATFQRGRLVLAAGPVDDALKSSGQADIQQALRELRPLAESTTISVEHRRRARALAGWIQIALGNAKAAENHFRASLEFGSDPGVELGLAQALVTKLEKTPPDDARDRSLARAEAKQLVDKLEAMAANAAATSALRDRLDQLP
jgi:4-amino-4-deoxy-L-arabinose transferase-like glycosyltransferase/tetratricopeptide (TPR) repeat protein